MGEQNRNVYDVDVVDTHSAHAPEALACVSGNMAFIASETLLLLNILRGNFHSSSSCMDMCKPDVFCHQTVICRKIIVASKPLKDFFIFILTAH